MVKYCQNCGAEIDDKAVMCPKCGVSTGKLTSNKLNPLALAGFITSLVSFLISLWGIVGIIAIILSIIGYSQTTPGETDRKLAIAGIIIGIVSVILTFCLILFSVGALLISH